MRSLYIRYRYCFVFLLMVGLFGVPFFVFAQTGDTFGTSYLSEIGLGTQDIRTTILRLFRVAFGILGTLTLLIIIYAGYVWMTSAGKPESIDRAKKIMINAVIGLIIIILAAGLTEFIFNQLVSRGIYGGPGSGGNPNSCAPANACVADCGFCNASGIRVFDQSCGVCSLGTNGFELRSVQTAHGGSDAKSDVYLCSRVQPQFNSSVQSGSVPGNASVHERLSGVQVNGTWQTSGNSIQFVPDNTFAPNRDYEVRLYTTLTSSAGDLLSGCNGTVCETSPGSPPNDFYGWQFSTGIDTDTAQPTITGAYPRLDNTSRQVSRSPVIDVTYSEAVDFFTISDGAVPARPIAGSFSLERIDGPGGSVIAGGVPNSDLLVSSKNNGFRVKLDPASGVLLDPYVWYRITVQGVQDLCGNGQEPPVVSWEFQTNASAPGVTGKTPTNQNSCPDTTISFAFGTAMYNELVVLDINGQFITLQPDEVTQTQTVSGFGTLRVLDPGDPVNGHYRNFEFIPASPLAIDTAYTVTVSAPNLIIDGNGGTLSDSWTFATGSAGQCACEPYITRLSPNQGPAGQCMTIQGRCLQGTASNPGVVSAVRFVDSFENVTGASINGQAATYVTTDVPTSLGPDAYTVEVELTYADSNYGSLTSNRASFLVDAGSAANGPCLYTISPAQACNGASITLNGVRFGSDPGSGNRATGSNNISFSNNGIVPDASVVAWSDSSARFSLPQGFTDGDVTITANGAVSNGLPFDVACGVGAWCSSTPSPQCTPNNTLCDSNVCDANCACLPTGGTGGNEDGIFRIVKAWPQCSTSCPNAQLGATFNRAVDASSITPSTVIVASCTDGIACQQLSPIGYSSTITGQELDIIPGAVLTGNAYYRVIITDQVRDVNGLALTQKNYDYGGIGMNNSYSWTFKTQLNGCTVTAIDVVPDSMQFNDLNVGQSIMGRALSDQGCFGNQPIVSSGYDWFWTQDNASVINVTYLDQNGDGLTDSSQRVTSVGLGTANAIGRINGTAFEDQTTVTVSLNFAVNQQWPTCATACLNSEVGVRFNSDIQKSSVHSGTVAMYECNDGAGCNNLTPISVSLPASNTNEIIITPSGMNVNTYYRVVLSGGEAGIRGVNGESITNVNYDFDATPGNDSFSWTFKTNETDCTATGVVTQPASMEFTAIGQQQSITGKAITDQGCYGNQFITASDFDWRWSGGGGSADGAGQIAEVTSVDANNDGLYDPVQTVSSVNFGQTSIVGTVVGGTEALSGTTQVSVIDGVNIPVSCDSDPATPQCNPSANKCSSTTFCNPSSCLCETPEAPTVLSIVPSSGSAIACTNAAFRVMFNQPIKTQNTASYFTFETNQDTATSISKSVSHYLVMNGQEGCTWDEGCSVFTISPTTGLPANNSVSLTVNTTVTSKYGVALASPTVATYSVGSSICSIDGVEVQPAMWFVSLVPASNTFVAQVYSNQNGTKVYLTPISTYSWTWTWQEADPLNLVTMSPNAEQNTVDATTRGKAVVTITGTATVDVDTVNNGRDVGKTKKANARINIYVCDNPWPEPPPYTIGWNAIMLYCRGDLGQTLLPTMTESTSLPTSGSLLKDRIFTIDQTPGALGNDVIGFRVYSNPSNLSAAAWYAAQDFPKGNPRGSNIGGYDAVIDGRTVYVRFLDTPSAVLNNYSSYILVLSYNQDPTAATQSIYNALLNDIKFNINLNPQDQGIVQEDF